MLHKVDTCGQATAKWSTLRAVASSLATWTEGEGTLRASKTGSQTMGLERSPAVLVSLGLLILGLCVGCGEPPPLDLSLLTGEPCEPPCWQGLTPGMSTHEEVNEFIRTSRFVNPKTLHLSDFRRADGQRVGVSIWWRSTVGGGRGSNNFTVEGGVLKDITMYPDYDLALGRLIDRYGPPEKYIASRPISGPLYYEVTLFYPTHGFTVDLVLPYEDGTLQPESRVASVWYFRAAPLERFMELRYEAGGYGGPPDDLLGSLRDWQGYGPIELE